MNWLEKYTVFEICADFSFKKGYLKGQDFFEDPTVFCKGCE